MQVREHKYISKEIYLLVESPEFSANPKFYGYTRELYGI